LGALGYSRDQESRADQAGAGFLEATGQSGRGLVEFFDNFRYQEVFDQSRRFAYFRSHPLSGDRIDALRSRVEKLPHYNAVDDPASLAEHEIMKAKLEGFINPGVAIVKYKENDRAFPARYARAIAYYQMKEPDRALKILDGLIAENPNNPYLWELKGQILFEFNRVKEAEGAAAPLGGAQARRRPAARQSGPDPDRPRRSQEGRGRHQRAEALAARRKRQFRRLAPAGPGL
jgi:predicted Zn-dependent protease